MNSNIEEIRDRLHKAQSLTLGEELSAFLSLRNHPDLTWGDLLGLLRYSRMTAENAALELSRLLKVPRDTVEVNVDRDFWERILETRGLGSEQKVGGTGKQGVTVTSL